MPITNSSELRILPLGASIVAGSHSTDGNGFRERLQYNLAAHKVRFAGVNRNGTMADGWHVRRPFG